VNRASPSASPRGARTAFLVWAGFAIAGLAAGWVADPRTWGVHVLAFLPRAAWFGAALVLGVLVHPGVAARVGGAVASRGSRLVDSNAALIAGALVFAAVCFALRLQFQFLGDGIVWLEKIQTQDAFHHFEPLATFVVRKAAQAFPESKPAAQSVSVVCGVAWWFAAAAICRRLFASDAATRATLFVLLIVHPIALLFCGYVESYPLLLAAQAVVVALWVRGANIWLGVAAVGVAVALHLQAIAWLPALAWMIALRTSRPALGVVAAVAAVAIGAGVAAAIGANPTAMARALGGSNGLGGFHPAAVWSPARFLDVVNEAALVLASAVALGAAAWGRKLTASWWRDARYGPLVLLALGAALLWFVPPRIGAARDWDLYTALVLPAMLCAGEAARRATAAWTTVDTAAWRGRIFGLALVSTVAWVWSQVDDTRAAERTIVLQSPAGTYSNFARGYTNEALGMYYRTRDPNAARDAYARATDANPNNSRYWNNLAMHEVLKQDFAPAVVAWRRALALGMHEWYVYYNLCMAELELHHGPEALALGDEMVRRWPNQWQSWMGRGQALLYAGRAADAAADLERAHRLMPQQPEIAYALGLALQSASQFDAARAAFATVLRLAPNHADARRELARIDAATGAAPR
jgi:tetratricopeptide (TPR) repeat protein